MTLVVAWMGVDSRKITSAYIATDSRITWNDSSRSQYDHAVKTFSLDLTADIIGFCGDVLYPTMILGQITELADKGLLFAPDDLPSKRSDIIYGYIVKHYKAYPFRHKTPVKIIHIGREYDKPNFYCSVMSYEKTGPWVRQEKTLPTNSETIFVDGSGASAFFRHYAEFLRVDKKRTSRNVFHSFCYTLAHPDDKSYGGSPQLVGIYAKPASTSKTFGIIHNNKRYYMGAELGKLKSPGNIEWRNDFFEICNGKLKKRKPDAAKQPYSIC